jgi:hypothetical protein
MFGLSTASTAATHGVTFRHLSIERAVPAAVVAVPSVLNAGTALAVCAFSAVPTGVISDAVAVNLAYSQNSQNYVSGLALALSAPRLNVADPTLVQSVGQVRARVQRKGHTRSSRASPSHVHAVCAPAMQVAYWVTGSGFASPALPTGLAVPQGVWVRFGTTIASAAVVNSTHVLATMPGVRGGLQTVQAPRDVSISFDAVQWVRVGTVQESYTQCAVVNEPFTCAKMLTAATGREPVRRQLWATIPSGRVALDCRCVGRVALRPFLENLRKVQIAGLCVLPVCCPVTLRHHPWTEVWMACSCSREARQQPW